LIPKRPDVPPLTKQQIKSLTNIVFLEENQVNPRFATCDLLFVFGGTHPGSWQTALSLYQKGKIGKIVVTGGIKQKAIRHNTWTHGARSEASVMHEMLVSSGVPASQIMVEDQSTNTLENIEFTKQLIDFSAIQTLGFVCKSYGAGRQYRTLQKHLPNSISLLPFSFDTSPWEDRKITRENWMKEAFSRSFVYGEYLRIVCYGQKGDIVQLALDEADNKALNGLTEDYDF
jgi:uncharacterized SAM-binding protein YcdF (DUF218 family)